MQERLSNTRAALKLRMQALRQEVGQNYIGAYRVFETLQARIPTKRNVESAQQVPGYVEYIDSGPGGDTLFLELGGAFESLNLRRLAAHSHASESLRYMAVDYTTILEGMLPGESGVDRVVSGVKALIASTGVKKVIVKGTSLGGLLATEVAESLVQDNASKQVGDQLQIGLIKSHSAEKDAEIWRNPQYFGLGLMRDLIYRFPMLWQNRIHPEIMRRSFQNRAAVDRDAMTDGNRLYFELADFDMSHYLQSVLTDAKAMSFNKLLLELTRHTRRLRMRTLDDVPGSLSAIPILVLQSEGDQVMKDGKTNTISRFPHATVETVSSDGHSGSITAMYTIFEREADFIDQFRAQVA